MGEIKETAYYLYENLKETKLLREITENPQKKKILEEKMKDIESVIKSLQKICNHKDTKGNSTIVDAGINPMNFHTLSRCTECGYIFENENIN